MKSPRTRWETLDRIVGRHHERVKEQLRADIQVGIDDLEAGNWVDADQVYAEARRRIKAAEEGRVQ